MQGHEQRLFVPFKAILCDFCEPIQDAQYIINIQVTL